MPSSVLTRKDKVSRLNLHAPGSRSSWLRGGGPCWRRSPCPGVFLEHPVWVPPTGAQAGLRRQISAGAALGARSPDPVQLSSRREPGTQDPAGPQALQTAGGEVPRTAHQAKCCCPSVPVWGLGSASLRRVSLGPASRRRWRGLWSPAGHSP